MVNRVVASAATQHNEALTGIIDNHLDSPGWCYCQYSEDVRAETNSFDRAMRMRGFLLITLKGI